VVKFSLSSSSQSASFSAASSPHSGEWLFALLIASCSPRLDDEAVSFLSGLGRRIADISGESREGSFLFQWLSVLIQRFNAVLLHDCFVDEVAGHSS